MNRGHAKLLLYVSFFSIAIAACSPESGTESDLVSSNDFIHALADEFKGVTIQQTAPLGAQSNLDCVEHTISLRLSEKETDKTGTTKGLSATTSFETVKVQVFPEIGLGQTSWNGNAMFTEKGCPSSSFVGNITSTNPWFVTFKHPNQEIKVYSLRGGAGIFQNTATQMQWTIEVDDIGSFSRMHAKRMDNGSTSTAEAIITSGLAKDGFAEEVFSVSSHSVTVEIEDNSSFETHYFWRASSNYTEKQHGLSDSPQNPPVAGLRKITLDASPTQWIPDVTYTLKVIPVRVQGEYWFHTSEDGFYFFQYHPD